MNERKAEIQEKMNIIRSTENNFINKCLCVYLLLF